MPLGFGKAEETQQEDSTNESNVKPPVWHTRISGRCDRYISRINVPKVPPASVFRHGPRNDRPNHKGPKIESEVYCLVEPSIMQEHDISNDLGLQCLGQVLARALDCHV